MIQDDRQTAPGPRTARNTCASRSLDRAVVFERHPGAAAIGAGVHPGHGHHPAPLVLDRAVLDDRDLRAPLTRP
jgi:hypothetical protein